MNLSRAERLLSSNKGGLPGLSGSTFLVGICFGGGTDGGAGGDAFATRAIRPVDVRSTTGVWSTVSISSSLAMLNCSGSVLTRRTADDVRGRSGSREGTRLGARAWTPGVEIAGAGTLAWMGTAH